MLRIHNTLSKQLEKFTPQEETHVSFYHCGPTVYWVQHIGNMRGMTMADLIRRSLEYLGYNVDFVRNYTDVGHLTSDEDEGEDKMEKGAKREGKTPEEIAAKYIKLFEHDIQSLNHLTLKSRFKPTATDYIPQMISMVEELLENGFAYTTPKAIYFDVQKKKDYTKLSRQKLEFNKSGAGTGDVADPDKRNPQDFAVWFFKTGVHKNALQTWKSPFNSPEVEDGEGFPGWHIECSAMSRALLGDTLDIHMGGIEHIPVHHTNEIAQSESATGKTFVNYWIHNEHLTVDGAKMAKSSGTSYSLSDITDKGFEPLVLRYFFLNSHYRSKQNFTWEALEAAKISLERLTSRVRELNNEKPGEIDQTTNQKFISAIEDDFNIPEALAVSWELLKSDLDDATKLATILKFDEVLGLKLSETTPRSPALLPKEALKLLDKRLDARKNKNWDLSDTLRDQLKEEFGIEVKDTEEGQVIG